MVDNVIKVKFGEETSVAPADVIDLKKVSLARRTLPEGMIAPAVEDTDYAVVNEHASEPIKRPEDIEAVSRWFIDHGRYRDNMLFIVGINFGLRVSDLLTLRFSHLIDENFCFKTTFPILEKKTRNTRKVKKNRYITVNDAVVDAVTLYLEHTTNVRLSDYMFRGESNRCGNVNKPMHRNSVERILKEAGAALNLDVHIATHTLRKTFAYHQMLISGNDPRKLLLLQKMFGHSTSAQTLDYIGITNEEVRDAYLELNLGHSITASLIGGRIFEEENTTA